MNRAQDFSHISSAKIEVYVKILPVPLSVRSLKSNQMHYLVSVFVLLLGF